MSEIPRSPLEDDESSARKSPKPSRAKRIATTGAVLASLPGVAHVATTEQGQVQTTTPKVEFVQTPVVQHTTTHESASVSVPQAEMYARGFSQDPDAGKTVNPNSVTETVNTLRQQIPAESTITNIQVTGGASAEDEHHDELGGVQGPSEPNRLLAETRANMYVTQFDPRLRQELMSNGVEIPDSVETKVDAVEDFLKDSEVLSINEVIVSTGYQGTVNDLLEQYNTGQAIPTEAKVLLDHFIRDRRKVTVTIDFSRPVDQAVQAVVYKPVLRFETKVVPTERSGEKTVLTTNELIGYKPDSPEPIKRIDTDSTEPDPRIHHGVPTVVDTTRRTPVVEPPPPPPPPGERSYDVYAGRRAQNPPSSRPSQAFERIKQPNTSNFERAKGLRDRKGRETKSSYRGQKRG